MVPIVGKPIVARVMDPMIENGIQKFILVISPDDDEILTYFNSNQGTGIDIKFISQPEPLGMGHALLQAKSLIHGDFLLSSCDNLVDSHQIRKILSDWEKAQPNAILTTLKVGPEEIVRMGIIAQIGDRITRIVEKPTLENAPSDIGSVPLYIFSYRLLDYLSEIKPSPRGEYELQDAIQELIQRDGNVLAHRLSGRIDLTNPEDLLELNLKFLSEAKPASELRPESLGDNTCFMNPVFIETGVRIGSNCNIGPNVYLETGVTIGDDVHLENVVVLRQRTICDKTKEQDKVIW